MRYLMDGLVSRVFYFFTSAGITFGSGLAIVISYTA